MSQTRFLDTTQQSRCRVLLTMSFKKDVDLVNGSRGTCKKITNDYIETEFENCTTFKVPRVSYKNKEQMWRQFPLIPAEATTVHNTQGRTFESVVLVTSDLFGAEGLVNTALSRARCLKFSRVSHHNVDQWTSTLTVKEEYEHLST
ncbi:unnamed protein product [Caenorhabditis brenneri]